MKIDTGLVPNVEDHAAFGGVLTKRLDIESLQDVHIVFLLPDADSEGTQRVPAQIQSIEMTDSPLGPADGSIVCGGPVPVAIPGIEIEICQIGIGA